MKIHPLRRFVFIFLAAAFCLGLCSCGNGSDETGPVQPALSASVREESCSIAVSGQTDLPDGTVITLLTAGDGGARAAVLSTYSTYTGLAAWCDQNGLADYTAAPRKVKVLDGKFYGEISLEQAPAQKYTVEAVVLTADNQPEKTEKLLAKSGDPSAFFEKITIAYPNEGAAAEAKDKALMEASDFIGTHTQQLGLLCSDAEKAFETAFTSDPVLGELEPASDPICTIVPEADCIVMTLDSVYWDYYLSPGPEVADYRSELVDSWLVPCVKRCGDEINILYGHNPCGRFMASDGRVIATMTDSYKVAFDEETEAVYFDAGNL